LWPETTRNKIAPSAYKSAVADEMLADLLHLRDTAKRAALARPATTPPKRVTMAPRPPALPEIALAWLRTKHGRAATIAAAVIGIVSALALARSRPASAAPPDLHHCAVIGSPQTESGRVTFSISCDEK
jgi:hypothetical protein